MLKNTTKPLRICIESAHETNFIIDVLAAAVGGREALREKPVAYLEISSVSPLSYAEGPGDGLLDVVEAGLPLGIIPCPMMGATGPMTLIGSVTMHNAEIVAGVVIAQLLNPGLPTIMSPRVTFMDMSSGLGLWAAPEMGLAAAASAQMALYYNIPSTVTGFSCASKVSDEQASFETFYNSFLPALVGVDVCGASGSLDNALISDYRKLIVDNEITSLIHRTLDGDVVNEDTLAVQVVDDVVKGGTGSFLANRHTMKHVRTELWKPILSDRSSYGTWEVDSTTFGERAQALAKKLLAEHQPTPLSPEALAKVEAVVQAATDATPGA
jgi:trimethylamine--corrinoid protein Co-methyltransferase